MDNEARIDALFSELVPPTGPAETWAGEVVRAICRIGYRWYNDGDQIGIGYGKETCNPAARFLKLYTNKQVRKAVDAAWGIYDDDAYQQRLNSLETAVLNFLDSNGALKEKERPCEIWDCRDWVQDIDDSYDDEYDDDDYDY